MTAPDVPLFTTTCSTRTITVTATDAGQLIELRFDATEYAYGAAALAAEIQRLAQRCTLLARARRRDALAALGLADVLLDRLGLPGPETVATELARLDAPAADAPPHSWMRAL
ncbi:hypothetical protein D7D52_34200 [Nocardia yunnanensis]|uniref:Uncharacterized protein n=1 Tax=Nocardia yunnanensis TaxID=2382165 RepID=A0A386ZMW5_9NOCA|nr:hypothetical protein [Nocardia yunnanensis]AYF78039.1 hypothetical protein D7D52_34200 [Nocardia yunnanensis]